ncbi:hypothetical protein [Virgibacillus ihumii]|uniref:hypothetical protein n=1 Tax=Virgibacillus ihumii TaxID=2686091 RepID=UPI00157D31DA|nr:hypothetical protein [Virgibacillus ihumii]
MRNINRMSRTSTVRAKHQPHEQNINYTSGTSTVRAGHQPYERNINRYDRKHYGLPV